MASIKFDFTGDNSNVLSAMQGVQNGVRQTAKVVEDQGESIEQMFNRVKNAAAASLAGFSIKEFITKCASIRGEFQQLEAAFTTLLGNAEQAQDMMTKLTNLAATTPFDMKGVASSAKQLLAYGVAADDVVDTMRRLGDIAAGLSLNLSDLAWLYGTTLTQGRMFTMDLRQFQARGIPMADELAKIFGVQKDEVAGLVTEGKVGAEQVTQAIKNMTDAGSRFGGLMEMQSHTITGQWSNIQDTIEMAFNDLGKQQEGLINDALSLTSLLVDHWKQIGTAILSVAAAYGTYKAALLTTTAIQNAQRNYRTNTEVTMLDQEIAKYQELIPAKEAVANADLQEAVAKGQLTAAQAELIASKREELALTKQQSATTQLEGDVNAQIAALQALKTANDESIDSDLREAVASGQITQAQATEIQSKRNLIASLQQEAQARVQNLQTKAEEAKASYNAATAKAAEASNAVDTAQEALDAARSEYEAAVQSGDANRMATAEENLNSAAVDVNAAKKNLKAARTEVATAAENMNTTAETANTAQQQLNTAMTGANTTSKAANTGATATNTTATITSTIATKAASAAEAVFAVAINGVKDAWNAMKLAMATNPIGAILSVVSLAVGAFMTFADTADDAAEASKRFGENADKEIGDVNVLVSTLENIDSSTNTYQQAMEELNKELDKYNIGLVTETTSTAELIKKKEELIEKINEERDARVKANNIDTMQKNRDAEIEKQDQEFQDALKEAEHIDTAGFAYWDSDDIQKIAYGLAQTLNAKIKSEIPDIMKLDGDARQQAIANLRKELSKIMTDAGVSEYNASFVKGSFDWNSGTWNDALYEQINALLEINDKWKDNTDVVTEYNDEVQKTAPTLADQYGQSEETMSQFFDQMEQEMYTGQATASDYSSMLYALVPDDLDPTDAFGKLQDMEDAVKKKIDEINARKILISADYQNLYGLNSMLAEIQSRMNGIANFKPGTAKTKNNLNTINGIQAELKAVNEALGNATIGSSEYKNLVKYRDNLKKKIPNDASYHKPKAPKTSTPKKDDKLQAAKDAANFRETQRELAKQEARDAVDMEFERRQAILDARKDSSSKELEQAQLDFEKEKVQIDRWYDDLKDEKIKKAKQLYNANPKNKKSVFNPNSVNTTYSKEETDTYNSKMLAATEKLRENMAEPMKEQQNALTDYLKTYGSFQEQKLAIALKYDDLIADADTDAEKRKLQKDKEKETTDVEANAIQAKIDWSQVFSGLGTVMKSELQPMLNELKAYTGTDKFQQLAADQQKNIIDAMDNIRQMIGTTGDVKWQDLANSVRDYQSAMQGYNEAMAEYSKAEEQLVPQIEATKKAMKDAVDSGDTNAFNNAKMQLDQLTSQLDDAGQKVAQATSTVRKSGNTLATTTKDVTQPVSEIYTFLNSAGLSTLSDLWQQFDKLRGAIDGLKSLKELSKDASDAGKNVSDVAKSVGKNMEEGAKSLPDNFQKVLSKGGFIAQIISAVLSILDILKDGIGTVISSLIDTILQAINGIIKNIISGKFIAQIGGSLISGIGDIVDTVLGGLGSVLSFGALSSKGPSAWFTNSNAKEVAKKTEDLTKSNDALKNAVDNLKDSIDKSGGAKAVRDYQQAYQDQQSINQNTMDILRTQMGYHASHHSNAHYWNLDSTDYAAINQTLAQYATDHPDQTTKRNSVYSLNDIYELTPEQMQAISAHNVEIWQKMLDAGKYDKSEYWENYIALAGQLEELTEKINENLTQTSFDSLKSNFVSDVMDMSKTWSDFTDDLTEMIAKAWTNAAVNDLMSDDLKKFYNGWAAKMKAGTLTNADIEELRKEYEDLATQAINIRDTMTSVTGYTGSSDSQSASANGVTSITYDQANQFIGLVTAGNIIAQNISDSMLVAVATLSTLNTNVSSQNGTLSEIRNLMIFGNSYLEDTLKYVKFIYNDFSVKLDKTNEYLKEMK